MTTHSVVSDPRAPSREDLAEALRAVRRRTLQLIDPLSRDALTRQHDPLMSPIVWDLGHIGAFEELWLVRRPGAVRSESELEEVYDAFRTPRSVRGTLRLPGPESVLARMAEVRERALALLEDADFAEDNPLLRDGFAWEMVRAHEAQHQETILQTILLMTSETYRPVEVRDTRESKAPVARSGEPSAMVRVPAGPFTVGAAKSGFSYDNERPRHVRNVAAFEIATHPVTNSEYVEFIAAGGYREPALWSEAGRAWSRKERLAAPKYWRAAGGDEPLDAEGAGKLAREKGLAGFERRTSLGAEALHPDAPVTHVCCHEAEAFARFSGCRLPTEIEWEKAAAWDPDRPDDPRRFPWGDEPPRPEHANLDQLAFGTLPVGTHPEGRSALGVEELLGDVWEWTASSFEAYPGFSAFPYDEYSMVFFGPDYRVLRGGSWATRPAVMRSTFRNWDYPIRRQIFSGLRLARDL